MCVYPFEKEPANEEHTHEELVEKVKFLTVFCMLD